MGAQRSALALAGRGVEVEGCVRGADRGQAKRCADDAGWLGVELTTAVEEGRIAVAQLDGVPRS